MKNGERVLADLVAFERLRDFFTSTRPVPAAYLFGSRASGGFSPTSDIDVAVILPRGMNVEDAFWKAADIKDSLEDVFRPLKVDVLDMERVPSRIAHEILKTGLLIAQNDSDRRVGVEARRQSEYFDFLPRLRYYRKEVLGIDEQGEDH